MASDTLLLRASHHMKSRAGKWQSTAKMGRSMRVKSVEELQKRVDYLVGKGLVSVKEGRVYNGLPVILYSWKED